MKIKLIFKSANDNNIIIIVANIYAGENAFFLAVNEDKPVNTGRICPLVLINVVDFCVCAHIYNCLGINSIIKKAIKSRNVMKNPEYSENSLVSLPQDTILTFPCYEE